MSAEIREMLATKVMGWTRKLMCDAYPGVGYTESSGLTNDWHDASGKAVANIECCGDYYCSDPHCGWDPLTDANASKQLREKLAELGYGWHMSWLPSAKRFVAHIWPVNAIGDTIEAEGETEESAWANVALLSVGVDLSSKGNNILD